MLDKYEKAMIFFKNNKKYSIIKVAKIFHIDRLKLGKLLHQKGIYEDRRIKYSCNEKFFDVIDDEDKAYWLGFIMADGCIKNHNIFSFALAIKDKEIVKKLKKSLNATHPLIIEEIRGAYASGNQSIRLTIHNKHLCDTLNQYGIIPNKTFKEKFNYNNKIPDRYINAYIRGIFDGDGWFSIYPSGKEFGICGTKDLCQGIADILYKKLDISVKVSAYKSIYRLRITNTKDILKIFDYIYKDAKNYLTRKYEKLNNFAVLNESTN